jgi:hypothetical protein
MDVSDTDPKPPPRGWLRAHGYWLGIALALLLVYALAGFFLVPRIGRAQAIKYVEQDMHRQLRVGALAFNPFTLKVEIRDLELSEADGSPIAGFALLRVELSAVSSLLHRAWTLSEVRIEQPSVNALIDATGSLNLARLAPPPKQPPEPSGGLPALRIGAFTVNQGRLHLEDRSRGRPFTASLAPIEFTLADFRTQPDFENRYRFSATTGAGEGLEWAGQFALQPVGSNGEFTLSGLKATTIAAYLEDGLPFALPSGSLDLHGEYKFSTGEHADLSLTLPSIQIHALSIAPRGTVTQGSAPWISLPELDIDQTSISVPERRLSIGRVSLHNPTVQIWREADNSLNLQRLSAPSASAAPPAGAAPAAAAGGSGAPWKLLLARLQIEGADLAFEDRAVAPTVKLRLTPLVLTLDHLSSDGSATLGYDLQTAIDTGRPGAKGSGTADAAQLHASGSFASTPVLASLSVDLKGLNLSALQPYIAQQLPLITLYRGRLASQLQLAYAAQPAKGQPQLKLSGGIDVTDLGTRDNLLRAEFVSWKSLKIEGLRYQRAPDALDIERVSARGAYARVIIAANGSLNLAALGSPKGAAAPAAAVKPTQPPAAAKRSAATAQSTMPIRIRRVEIEDGTADFTDHSVQPNFSTAMLGLHGAITGLSSNPQARAQLNLDGNVDRYAPVTIKGELNPFAATGYTDISLSFHNIELTTFNPYSDKFAGYAIDEGKLSTDLHYHVENRKLEASHHVVIDQLKWGAATESKQAVSLPVRLATALLKDRNGVITLDLPVSGSIDDPTFKIGPIVWKLFVGLVTKIVTAPFAALGALFGGGEQLAYVDFPAGSATLPDAEVQKLSKLASALLERPQLKLDIPLHAVSEADDAALSQASLERAVAETGSPEPAQGARHGSRKAGAAAAAVGATSPRLQALLLLYRKTMQAEPQFPDATDATGSGATGAAATDPAAIEAAHTAWLEQQLLAHFKPSADDRLGLGRARAEAAQATLLSNKELSAERLFLTERESGGGTTGQVRMEMKLQ